MYIITFCVQECLLNQKLLNIMWLHPQKTGWNKIFVARRSSPIPTPATTAVIIRWFRITGAGWWAWLAAFTRPRRAPLSIPIPRPWRVRAWVRATWRVRIRARWWIRGWFWFWVGGTVKRVSRAFYNECWALYKYRLTLLEDFSLPFPLSFSRSFSLASNILLAVPDLREGDVN